jgi:RND superfamily putative drug exporter
VAFGVLLDTVLVRSLLVPALTYDIGPRIWWPSKLGRPELDAATKRDAVDVELEAEGAGRR